MACERAGGAWASTLPASLAGRVIARCATAVVASVTAIPSGNVERTGLVCAAVDEGTGTALGGAAEAVVVIDSAVGFAALCGLDDAEASDCEAACVGGTCEGDASAALLFAACARCGAAVG